MTTVVRMCSQCGGPMPPTKRADALYCTATCKQAAYEQRQRRARIRLLDDDVQGGEGGERDELFDRLRVAVKDAVREEKLLAVIAAEARHNWRASAWLLSRAYPSRWGERGRDSPFVLDDPADPFVEADELAARRRSRRDEQ